MLRWHELVKSLSLQEVLRLKQIVDANILDRQEIGRDGTPTLTLEEKELARAMETKMKAVKSYRDRTGYNVQICFSKVNAYLESL